MSVVATRLVPAIALLGLLAACSGGLFGKERNLPCPTANVVSGAERITQYRPGPGRDITDVAYEAEIVPVAGSCEYVDDDKAVEVLLKVEIRGTRGPGAEGRTGDFAFFSAVTDGEQDILARQRFSSPVEFPAGRSRAGVSEEIRFRIPLKPDQFADAFEILVGFELTREQLEENRNRLSR
ncbi:hypothetical protein [Oceanibacterium hippocampi]|uniref:Lipoprotein n=1 Tax=Oceanibacterium hippocampi TaxID=745714 RepID=A0A1Y5SB60_9PROT|nr:hypothetical protein [Oceanibacterium hippocampi]SLN33712.1 hypothetical protein OCH7691_01293 [Oceanibacterium hippocampi]